MTRKRRRMVEKLLRKLNGCQQHSWSDSFGPRGMYMAVWDEPQECSHQHFQPINYIYARSHIGAVCRTCGLCKCKYCQATGYWTQQWTLEDYARKEPYRGKEAAGKRAR